MYLKRSAIQYRLWLSPDPSQCKFHGGTGPCLDLGGNSEPCHHLLTHSVDGHGTMGHSMLLLIGPKNEGLGQDIQISLTLKLPAWQGLRPPTDPMAPGCHKHHCYIPGKGWWKF